MRWLILWLAMASVAAAGPTGGPAQSPPVQTGGFATLQQLNTNKTINFSGADSSSNHIFNALGSATGTGTSYQSALFQWNAQFDQANFPNGYLDYFQFLCSQSGGNFGGTRDCMHTLTAFTATPTQPSPTGYNLVSHLGEGYATAGWGGTAGVGNAKGNLTGYNANVRITTGAPYWNILADAEFDISAGGATGLFRKYGLFLVETGNDTTDATGESAWIITTSGNGAVGMNTVISVGSIFSSNPSGVSTTGSIIKIANAATALGYGIDLNNGTFSNFAYRSPGFTVDGSGNAVAKTVQLSAYTVGTLPTCAAGLAGQIAYVTDANAPTYNATLTGSSTTKTLALCNGSAWVAH